MRNLSTFEAVVPSDRIV